MAMPKHDPKMAAASAEAQQNEVQAVKDQHESEISKGDAARQCRNVLTDAFESLREAKTKALADGKTPQEREDAWHRLKALDDLKLELDKLISRGEVAFIKANKQS